MKEIYIGFELEEMVPIPRSITRRALTLDEVKTLLSRRSVRSRCFPRHRAFIEEINSLYSIVLPLEERASIAYLNAKSEYLLMIRSVVGNQVQYAFELCSVGT